MKIARVESFLFDPGSTRNMLFCRIETEGGLHGWGEAYVTAETEKTVDEFLRAMAPHLIGRSAFDTRHTGQVLFNDFVIRRNSMGFWRPGVRWRSRCGTSSARRPGSRCTTCSAAARASGCGSMPTAGTTSRARWTTPSRARCRCRHRATRR